MHKTWSLMNIVMPETWMYQNYNVSVMTIPNNNLSSHTYLQFYSIHQLSYIMFFAVHIDYLCYLGRK